MTGKSRIVKPALAGVPIVTAKEMGVRRLSALLWGDPGCGKTTFACTAPGNKFLINLDPDGPQSVATRDDVEVMDLAPMQTEDVLKVLKSDRDPLGLNRFLDERRDIETVILDSVTAVARRGLEDAVRKGLGKTGTKGGKQFVPTMEHPGISAYGGRNAVVLTIMMGLLRVTARHNVHFVATAHEDTPVTNQQNEIQYITLMLGGKMVKHTSSYLSDIWWMSDLGKGKGRSVAIRVRQQRRPMKSRIFRQDGQDFFYFHDNDTDLLTRIWQDYVKGGGKKLVTTKYA